MPTEYKQGDIGIQQIIMDTAVRAYIRGGIEGATIQQVAEEAGVSPAQAARYLGSSVMGAAADWAAGRNLERLREIGAVPGMTLRRREWLVHEQIQQGLEEWRLILRTMVTLGVPFRYREVLTAYAQVDVRNVLERHLAELREPDETAASAFSGIAWSLQTGYVLDGREDSFRTALERHLDIFLHPTESARAAAAAME